MIKAVIFDMDGVLIDSEPLWQEAEKLVFSQVGIQLTTKMCMETMGMRVENKFEFIYPTPDWQTTELGDIHPEDFKVAEDLFYVDVKLKRVYLQE